MYHYEQTAASGGTLDRMRAQSGIGVLKSGFEKIAKRDIKKAVSLINSERLRFSTLYILLPEIVSAGLLDALNTRNRIALSLCLRIESGADFSDAAQNELPENDETRKTLQWVLLSGYPDDGLCDEFDHALDAAALLLIRIYHDSGALPQVIRLIFRRHREGKYIHDMVWALFGSHNPKILNEIAEYLRSPHKRDVELAGKLLRYATDAQTENRMTGQKKYTACRSWLRENSPYLDFTGESFHQSCEPELYRVNLEAKYLCGKTAMQGQKTADTYLSDNPLEAFRRMPDQQREILANYSNHLYRRNRQQWDQWRNYPIEKQLRIAHGRSGGLQ